MLPTFILGKRADVSPEIEFTRKEIADLIACAYDLEAPAGDYDGLFMGIAALDCMPLCDEEDVPEFEMLERTCRGIVAGTITHFNLARVMSTPLNGMLSVDKDGAGEIRPIAIAAARRFLDFLDSHPDHWPFRPTPSS